MPNLLVEILFIGIDLPPESSIVYVPAKFFNCPTIELSVSKVKPSALGLTVIAAPGAQFCVVQYKNSFTDVSQLITSFISGENFSNWNPCASNHFPYPNKKIEKNV